MGYHELLDQRDPDQIDLVVIHCTELPDLATAREYAERVIYDSGTGNCGHYYIDRDGSTVQYATVDRIAHHVRNYNERSVGIELVNSGRYPDWYHSEHQQLTEPYPDEQVEALIDLLRRLTETLPGLRHIAGHQDLDTARVPASDEPSIEVPRKIDPGPLFPWERLLDHVSLRRFSPE